MLKRLQTAQSKYNRRDWELRHRKTEYYMHKISQNADRNKHEFSYSNYFSDVSPQSRPQTCVMEQSFNPRQIGNTNYSKNHSRANQELFENKSNIDDSFHSDNDQ